MLAPLPPPDSRRSVSTAEDAIRLDVRFAGGKTVSYAFTEPEFLIGGAAGCDLRLTSLGMPPVACQFSQNADGLSIRKLAPAIAVSLNGKPLNGTTIYAIQHGDRILIGATEILVHIPNLAYLSPRLIPVEPEEQLQVESMTLARRAEVLQCEVHELETRKATLEQQLQLDQQELTREREELDRWRSELEQNSQELEEDRAIWYRRRQQWEQEFSASTAAESPGAQEEELARLRQQLFDEYSAKRDQLVQLREAYEAAEADASERRKAMEQELASRRAELEQQFEDRSRRLEAEIAQQRLQFEEDLRSAEPRLMEIRFEKEQLEATRLELEEQRRSLAELRSTLVSDRQAYETDLSWQRQQLAEQLSQIEAREAELHQREESIQKDRAELDQSQRLYKDDLARLDRWQSQIEAQQRQLDTRAAEVDHRLALLERDSSELEGHARLADSEHARLAEEAERLSRIRADLEAELARLADRSAHLESQQATLAVLRASLDRQQDDLRLEAGQLAAERIRQEKTRAELDEKILEAESLRVELGNQWEDHHAKQRALEEQNQLLSATFEDFRRQKDELVSLEQRLKDKEQELDSRSAEIAEQAAILKSRIHQALELQQRLEADRNALRERESSLSETDSARQEFQEHLRRRAEELTSRTRQVDELKRQLNEERIVLEQLRVQLDQERSQYAERQAQTQRELDSRAADLQAQLEGLTEREAALARQVARLREVGATVAAERKALFDSKQAWDQERNAALQRDASHRSEAEAFREQVARHFAELRAQAPELESQAQAALDRLASAREVLRGQLTELHDYARQTREELDASRTRVREESLRLRQQADEIESARSEHRLAVTGFRQQLLEWQAKLGEIRQLILNSESRLGQKQIDLEEANRRIEENQRELERQTAELRHERQVVAEKRAEMERHLADMREWYRRKLRELASGRPLDESDIPPLPVVPGRTTSESPLPAVDASTGEVEQDHADPEPADKQLGDLLHSRGFVDEGTLQALFIEARRQRRSLRQVLLSSGAVTLYQLAIIEAGNLDGLSLGRFRIVDRIRSTPRESVYRVFDPARPGGPTRGLYILRHMAESEMADAVRPDEFRQRFLALANHPHLNWLNTLEVLEISSRPACVQESVTGLPSTDWPAIVATPGVWLRLVSDAAKAIHHAHRSGITHGRLTADQILFTGDGILKIQGFGEPAWLVGGAVAAEHPLSADLRSLGQIAFAWAQLGSRRRGTRSKPFPNELTAIVRRLEIGIEPPMADVVAIDRPYADAEELLRDLTHLAQSHPCPADAWDKLLRYASENVTESPSPLRVSA